MLSDRAAEPDALTGETLLGRYLVEERVAEGGFAVVYRAMHLELGVPVAVKVLTAVDRYAGEARAAYLALFRQEARTLAALNHPALVRVLDFGAHRDRPWMALEWLDGTTLEEDLRARAGVGRSPREVLDLLRPAFDALAHAHDAGVSHRDIKPSNLMRVKAPRGAPALRVIDFGVAKVDDGDPDVGSGSTRTASPVAAFTAPYAAPEQVGRTRTGPWTDVHALALVVVEALVGARAYGAATGADLLEAVLREPRPTPARAGVDVGPWEAVLARALARLPAARPPSAAALWTELASSVEEAQRAWSASPRAPAAPVDASRATTAMESPPAPPGATLAPPPSRPRWIGPAAVAAVVAVVAALGPAAARPRRRPPVPVTPIAPPSIAPPSIAVTAPPVVVPAPPPVPAPPVKLAARRPSRVRPTPDAGARRAPVVEPTVVVE